MRDPAVVEPMRGTSLVDAFRRIDATPAQYRTWIDREAARGILGCTEEDLQALVESGLAHAGGQVERYDVWNTGLAQGATRSRGEREMIFFSRLLRSYGADWVSPFEYEVQALAECPEGDACAGQDWGTPTTAGARWSAVSVTPGRAEWRGRITMGGRPGQLVSPVLRARWQAFLAGYRFQFTSMAMAEDVALTRALGSGDCSALGRVLCADLIDAGWSAEMRAGYIFGGARTRWHRWVQVIDDDGIPKHLDPAMALLADRFFTPEYKAFCGGSLLNRIIPLDDETQFFVPHTCAGVQHDVYVTIGLRVR